MGNYFNCLRSRINNNNDNKINVNKRLLKTSNIKTQDLKQIAEIECIYNYEKN
jgi:hypothetical protein